MFPIIIGVAIVVLIAALLLFRRGMDFNSRYEQWHVVAFEQTDPIYNWHATMIMCMITHLANLRREGAKMTDEWCVDLAMGIDSGCAWMRNSKLAGRRVGEPSSNDYLRGAIMTRRDIENFPMLKDATTKYGTSDSTSSIINQICYLGSMFDG